MNILEICPYEPPASGWVNRIKLLRRVIEEDGGTCEILDIGPSRKLERPECISVKSGLDYSVKVVSFARRRFTFHCHINAEYFRGMLLALAALSVATLFRNRGIVTFHAGTDQPYLKGWKKIATWPFFALIFAFADATICNSAPVKEILSRYQRSRKIFPIQAFSRQYLEYETVDLEPELAEFMKRHTPLVSTYLCLRDGFFIDVLVDALGVLVRDFPNLGLIIVGTGGDLADFCEPSKLEALKPNLHFAGELDHDTFMSLVKKTDVSLRTPVTDGISATVLEALVLGIPVVASDNGNRPASVVTYEATSPDNLAEKLGWTFQHHANVAASMPVMDIPDTARTEVELLSGYCD